MSEVVTKLKSLAGADHFAEDISAGYPGCPDEGLRSELNHRFDGVITEFVQLAESGANQGQYLQLLEKQIAIFDRVKLDTEEAEQVGGCFEQIMECVGLESSEGALNTWLYGFDPGDPATFPKPWWKFWG